jgi:hypothetical protein
MCFSMASALARLDLSTDANPNHYFSDIWVHRMWSRTAAGAAVIGCWIFNPLTVGGSDWISWIADCHRVHAVRTS